jgi:hypothetical protein
MPQEIKLMSKTVNQVSQDELYALHCVIQACNNVNPGQLNEIHLCQPWLLYNQFPYKSKRIWGT